MPNTDGICQICLFSKWRSCTVCTGISKILNMECTMFAVWSIKNMCVCKSQSQWLMIQIELTCKFQTVIMLNKMANEMLSFVNVLGAVG